MGLGYNGVVKLLCACLALASVIGCASYPKEVVAERITVREIYLVDAEGNPRGTIQADKNETKIILNTANSAKSPEIVISSADGSGVMQLRTTNGEEKTMIGSGSVHVQSTADGTNDLIPRR
jgi:hypothetical protein